MTDSFLRSADTSGMLRLFATAAQSLAALCTGFVRLVTHKGSACTAEQMDNVRRRLDEDNTQSLSARVAAAWLSNPWFWIGASLSYTAPLGVLTLLWWCRTLVVLATPPGKDHPVWACTLAPPETESALLNSAAEQWEAFLESARKLDSNAVMPARQSARWLGIPVFVLITAPQGTFSTMVAVVCGAALGNVTASCAQMVAAQLIAEPNPLQIPAAAPGHEKEQ